MESGEIYQDFLREYQLLLENEKRRLNFVSEKPSNVTDEVAGHTSVIDETGKNIVEDEKTTEIENTVVKEQQIIQEDPKDAKCDNHKRTKMMEQWITDSFYTSFPSFSKQERNANQLADDRREDYKKYLAEVSNKKLLDAARGGRRRTDEYSESESTLSKPPQTARDRLLFDLKHTELTHNFHSPDAIDDRNQKVAMDRARRKVELQQELIKQIEDKKLQIEKIRAKEKEDEEMLQRRLENQMKALHMADELKKVNKEKVLSSDPISRTYTTTNAGPRRNINTHIDEFKAVNGSSAPENSLRNDVNLNSDRQIYKFFSNSAPHSDGHLNYYNQPVGFNNMTITNPYLHHISTAAHNPTQHCNRCRRVVPILCSSCCPNDLNPSFFCCYQCNLLQNMDSCNNCRREWITSWNHHGGVERGRFNVHHHRDSHRPQILEITYQDHSSQTNGSTTSPPSKRDSITVRSETPDTNGNLSNHKTHNNNHQTMTHSDKMVGMGTTVLPNIPESVSLSREDELLELKRRNDILIAKFARNYGSLRNRKSIPKETTTTSTQHTDDSFPLPLMREDHFTRKSFRRSDAEAKPQNSQAVRKLECKWEIPVVQRQVITNNPGTVLTQVGAIGKQLQLEKLNFGDE
ncbi:hypothetical protein HA402_014700 [Bradysia odoriphaga]|nr:hypothetical protein HA402_014700 [Bradysia odoriphaga]